MKEFKIADTYWNIGSLYSAAHKSKARRGLFGYMLFTGRIYDTILGGGFRLLMDMETLGKGECYSLDASGSSNAREIIAVVEVAMAGGFSRFEVPAWEIRKTAKTIKKLNIQEV